MDQTAADYSADPRYKGLYLGGVVAVLLVVLVFRRNFATEMMTFNGFGIFAVPQTVPLSAGGWFDLLGSQPLLGLVLYDLFDLVNYVLVAIIFLAAGAALWGASRSGALTAVVAALAAAAIYTASNQAFAMLNLSGRYAAAATAAQQERFLAAGEALLAIHHPGVPTQGTGILASLLLVLLAGLVISMVMWRSAVFSRATAVTGILANALTLLHFPLLLLAPGLLWLPHTLAAPLRLAWYILIALGLWRLWRAEPEPAAAAAGRL